MRYLFILIPAFFAMLYFSCKSEDDEVIIWNKNRQLNWSDYKGKPQKRFAAASTVYSLGRKVLKEKDGTVVARIQAYFYCNDSWKKNDWINDEVLSHEQKHFDIVELFSRKIRKQVSEMIFINFKDASEKVDSVYEALNKEMDVYQDKYDDETDGSMNGKEQERWEKKITGEINDLDKFENTMIPLKLKQ